MKQASSEVDGSAFIGISGTPPGGGFTRLGQQISTVGGQTQYGYLGFFAKKVGNGCDLTVELYTSSASKPNTQQGTVAVTLPADFLTTSLAWVYVPLPISGLTASTAYHAVLIAGDTNGNTVGDASNYIAIEKSTAGSGASTFAASTWSTAAYGFMYREFDQAISGALTMVYEDAGARWTYLGYDALGNVAAVNEYTLAQNTGSSIVGQMRSVRTLTVSPTSLPVSVA